MKCFSERDGTIFAILNPGFRKYAQAAIVSMPLAGQQLVTQLKSLVKMRLNDLRAMLLALRRAR